MLAGTKSFWDSDFAALLVVVVAADFFVHFVWLLTHKESDIHHLEVDFLAFF